MRIRKNAKQSTHEQVPESLRTHVCQLNQSPWDVTPFSPPPSPSYEQPPYPSLANYQFDGEDSLTGNGSLGDSIGAVESSVASMIDESEEKAAIDHNNNDYHNYRSIKSDSIPLLEENYEYSKMEDPFEFQDGPSEPILESCGIHNSTQFSKKSQKQVAVVVGGSSRRGRPRTVKKGSTSTSTSNPYEFYYYSGFGPSWRKRRGERGGDHHQMRIKDSRECDNDNSIITTQNNNNTAPFGGSNELYYLDDDEEEEDEEEEESGRKRMRKPVKARSLKSLM